MTKGADSRFSGGVIKQAREGSSGSRRAWLAGYCIKMEEGENRIQVGAVLETNKIHGFVMRAWNSLVLDERYDFREIVPV